MRKLILGAIIALSTCVAVEPSFAASKAPAASAETKAVSTDKSVKPAPKAQVNINSASAEEIAEVLVGIGAAKAEAIVAYREQNGGFKSVEELTEVKGIGEATLTKNKDRIVLQ